MLEEKNLTSDPVTASAALPDQEARDRARRSLESNVVVEAGAGTGKTTVLIDRFLFLLLAGGPEGQGLDITRLVALTFTEKAAGEIKVRLAGRLNDLLGVLEDRPMARERRRKSEALLEEVRRYFHRTPSQVRRAAEAALHSLDRAPIGTIHHFASLLLQLYPLESGVGPGFDVDTGPLFDDLFNREWALWLDQELGLEAPRRSEWLEALPLAPLEDLEELARTLCQEETGISAGLGRIGTTEAMRERVRGWVQAFGRLPDGKPPAPSNGRFLESLAEVSAHLQDLVRSFDEPAAPLPAYLKRHEFKEKTWPKAWSSVGEEERAAYEQGLRLAKATSAAGERLVQKAVQLVLPFALNFRETYRRRGLVSFSGLLTRALVLVRDHPLIRQALKARFDALLIDEFQDTDPLQGEILLFLAEERTSVAARWQDIRFAPGKIFVVGDPKQSIYRFRGADIRAYARFTELLLAQGAEKCNLQTNFRSPAGLVGPVNAVFRALMRETPGLQPAYLPIYAGPHPAADAVDADVPPALELVLLSPPSDESAAKLSADESVRLEARWIADWIHGHASPDPDRPEPGRHRLRDMAILLRTTSSLNVYVEALRDAGVPYVVEADRHFYRTQEIIDFVNLLRVLDDPSDKISMTGLLRSPLAALSDRDILSLAQADGLNYLDGKWKRAALAKDAAGRLEFFYRQLSGFHARVGRDPLGDFLDRLLRDSFLLELCSVAYQGEQTLSNLLKFSRLAGDAGDRGATLKQFIHEAVRSMEEFVQEGESPLADEHREAVRILTVHKAKGLEFPVVILPSLSARKGNPREKPLARVDWSEGTAGLRLRRARAADVAMALLEQEENRREEFEQVRLLYVAMTRAKERLILISQAAGGDKTSFSHGLRQAGLWPERDHEASEQLVAGWLVPVTRVRPGDVEKKPSRSRAAPKIPVPDLKAMAELWRERYTERDRCESLAVFARPTTVGAPDQQTPAEKKPGEPLLLYAPAPAAGSPVAATLVGQVCHRVLEQWDFQSGGSLAPAVERACLALIPTEPGSRTAEGAAPPAPWAWVKQEAQNILETFLASPAAQALAQSEILGREIPFLCPVDGKAMRGSLDVLFRRDGRLWVADYKTDSLDSVDPKVLAEAYRPQVQAYTAAVQKALHEPCQGQVIFLRTGDVVAYG